MTEVPGPPDEVPDVVDDIERDAQRSAGGGFDRKQLLMDRHSIGLLFDLQSQTIGRKLVEMIDIYTDLTVDSLSCLVDDTMRKSDVVQP